MKELATLLILLGATICAWTVDAWLEQVNAVTHDPDQVKQAHKGWDETDIQPTIQPKTTTSTKNTKDTPRFFETGEQVGKLEIPRIGNSYDVFWGTDRDTLKKGVGMYDSKYTVVPGQAGHVLLAGHRDTVFRKLKQVKKGDHLYVEFNDKTYDYQVRDIWITDRDDRSVIVKKQTPTLTLSTCYPFDYLGDAPKRYIIQSKLVSVEENNK
ncbi:class D sortase [Pontibacillus yanchengensis]|uniref:Peptidase n=1 Tax=Pontibacillus yanchengensis Y32 TaxID=1385514 RepID=A0A0A2TDD8_9BACI|nr:class D sortase [Pontibacillus yanchengensis]KGP73579.1 peptidase [Pontibacillus yanchengensis Y32]